jgi:hypothetical protein
MAYQITSIVGAPPIGDTSTTMKLPLGTIATARDATLGCGEFIYLLGVASTVVGSIVNYDASFQTALDSTGSALVTPRPLAVSMSANLATYYGWYQISGIATAVKANTVSFAAGAGLGAGSGLAVAVATGSIINGALVAVVASAKSDVTSVKVMVNRPHDPSDVS